MPAVSKAQFDKMHVLHVQGKITDQQLANYTVDVHYDKLPELVESKQAHRCADGDFIVPPGRYFATQVQANVAGETFITTIGWHEKQITLA